MNFTKKTAENKAKNFNRGKWIPKLTQATILLCECGNKYIKTREGQALCLKCYILERDVAKPHGTRSKKINK